MSLLILGSGFGTGTLFLEDDGTLGNGISRLRFSGTSVIPFSNPTDSLTVTSIAGQSFVINLLDSLTTATFTMGSLTNASINPDALAIRNIESAAAMTMAATNTINEGGNDVAFDIVATNLILSAGTGISALNALETQVSALEAETTTGGINIANFGSLVIGGLTNDVAGLAVVTSGDINLSTVGSILLSDENGTSSVKGGNTSGNVTLEAKGANSTISSSVDHDSIVAAGGSISLFAGNDIQFGLAADFDNDVRARGSIAISAGGDFHLDGFADIASDDFGANTGAGVTIDAQGDILITDTFGSDASITANGTAGADVVLRAGNNSLLSIQSLGVQAILSVSGNVIGRADHIMIAADSGITASAGMVALRPTTVGRRIDIGSAANTGVALGLSDAELDRISAPHLFIGGALTGKVTFSANASPLNAADFTVQSGADIVVNAGISVQAAGVLKLLAADDILLLNGSLAQGIDGLVGFVDNNDSDGIGGKAVVAATYAPKVHFVGNADSDTLFGGAAGDILNGKGAADTMAGRDGDDIYFVDNTGDITTEAAGEGEDTVRSSVTRTLGNDLERLQLLGNQDINGKGNALANTLIGNAGDNKLEGLGGADRLEGGRGNDHLIGGGGADSFLFNTVLNASQNVDHISGFSVAADTIELDDAIFSGLAIGTLSAAAFHKGASAADPSDRIIYNSANGFVSFDADGKNGDAAIHFATIAAGLAVTRNDFLVV